MKNELLILSKAMIKERKDIILSIICGFIAGIAGIALFSSSGYMIAQTVFEPPLYTLIIITSFVKLLGFVKAASRYGERLFTHQTTFSILSRVRTNFFHKLIPLAPGILNKNRSGDLLSRIVGDVESLQNFFLRVAYPPIIVLMVFLATIIFAGVYSIWIAALFVLGMLITALLVPALVLMGQRKTHEQVRYQRAKLSTEVTEMLYGFRELKLYGKLATNKQQLEQTSSALVDEQKTAATQLLRGQSLHAFVTFLVSWGVLALGAYLIADGQLAGVFLAMLVMASLTVFDEVAAMAILPAYKQDSEHAAKRLHETVNQSEVKSNIKTVTTNRYDRFSNSAVSMEFSNVSFQYEGEWRKTLQDISLQLLSGSKIAIVGPSGSGKSTLLELILKLRTPLAGQICLNGVSIDKLDEQEIWENTNVVLQHNHFFRGTLRDNLLLNEVHYSDEQLLQVIKDVELSTKTLDELIYEKGENLSDGEKQRLALARIFLRKGRLWLLDEPTSSLDYVTEQRVLHRLYEKAKDDTVIVICHRLQGLEKMDQIIVMEQGSIIEKGSYSELMEQKGYFYEMKQIEQEMLADS